MNTSVRRYAGVHSTVAAFALLTAACTPEPTPASPSCDRARWSLAWDDEGLPAVGAPLEWADPIVIEPIVGQGETTTYLLPGDYKNRQAYYLRTGDDGYHIRFGMFVGDGYPEASESYVDVFLNAERIGVVANGVELPGRVTVPLVERHGDVDIFIPYSRFRVGMNNVHFAFSSRTALRDRVPYSPQSPGGGWSVTVARDAVEPVTEWVDTPGLRSAPYRPGQGTRTTYLNARGEHENLIGPPNIEGSTFRATIGLQRDPRTLSCDPPVNDTFALIALLDGQPIPIAGHDRIIATLGHGERRELDFEIELPTSPGDHSLMIVSLPGLGRPAMLAGRRLPSEPRPSVPWPFLVNMAFTSWEVPPTDATTAP